MIYEFLTDDGRIVTASYPVAEAPQVGSIVMIDGEPARRIISVPGAVRGSNWKPYISSRLPRNLPGVPCTPAGKPMVESRAQEREICAKFGLERE